jgi:hypothetical protein
MGGMRLVVAGRRLLVGRFRVSFTSNQQPATATFLFKIIRAHSWKFVDGFSLLRDPSWINLFYCLTRY